VRESEWGRGSGVVSELGGSGCGCGLWTMAVSVAATFAVGSVRLSIARCSKAQQGAATVHSVRCGTIAVRCAQVETVRYG
jgi:hypothetical protein